MQAGVPAVATAVGGVPAVLGGGKGGLLVPPGDAAALARAFGRFSAIGCSPRSWRRAPGER